MVHGGRVDGFVERAIYPGVGSRVVKTAQSGWGSTKMGLGKQLGFTSPSYTLKMCRCLLDQANLFFI